MRFFDHQTKHIEVSSPKSKLLFLALGRNNARLLASGRVVASRRIKQDDELMLAYGPSYNI